MLALIQIAQTYLVVLISDDANHSMPSIRRFVAQEYKQRGLELGAVKAAEPKEPVAAKEPVIPTSEKSVVVVASNEGGENAVVVATDNEGSGENVMIEANGENTMATNTENTVVATNTENTTATPNAENNQ